MTAFARALAGLLLVLAALPPAPAVRAADWWDAIDPGGEGRTFSGSILIGATFPLTGEYEYYGQSALYGAAARVRRINDAGGINGKRLIVDWRDNRSDPQLTVKQVEELARVQKVPALVGPLLSDAAARVGELAEQYRFVVISPMSTANSVVTPDGWVFRSSFNNTAQADAITLYMTRNRGADSAGILFDPRHTFSRELTREFSARFREAGGRITASFPFEGKSLGSTLRLLASGKPDILFAPLYMREAIELMHVLKAEGVRIPVVGSDTWDNELILAASGRRLAGTVFASPLPANADKAAPAVREFFEAAERSGMENPDAQAAYAWDAVAMLEEAFKTGESGAELREGLLKIRNMELATGRVDVLPNHETMKRVLMLRIVETDGKLLPVFENSFDPFARPPGAPRQ